MDDAVVTNDLIVASAYGRGHWLASRLSQQGWKVTVLDFTASLGEFDPSHYDGPFGLLETDLVSGSQKTFWYEEFGKDSAAQVRGGYTLWVKEGPIEGYGALSNYQTQEHSIALSVRNYLHMVSDLTDVRLKAERAQLSKLPFSSSWLAALMHQLHANEFVSNHLALSSKHTTPFFAPYSIRKVDKESHSRALNLLRAKNVQVIRVNNLSSVDIESDESVLVQTDFGSIAGRSFVTTLSSRETATVALSLMRMFYPTGEIKAQWSWQKFDVQFAEAPTETPEAFVILQDAYLPWTHTNVIVVRANDRGWNCWLKLPSDRIKEQNYLHEQASDAARLINQRLPWSKAKVLAANTSAPDWLIFDSNEKQKLKMPIGKNIFISAPEHWGGVDPLSRMLAHREVLGGLESIRRVWDARQARREEKELKRLKREKEREERNRK